MKKIEDYRPEVIEFTADSKQVPTMLGEFESNDEARLFMAENFLAIQSKITVTRKIDDTEKQLLREQYVDELEENLPVYRNAYHDSVVHLEDAKKREKDSKEMVNASLNKIQQLADEVNDGRTDMELDSASTWEVVYANKKFYYTYMDGAIKLAKVEDVPSYEADDLISTSEKNSEYFAKLMEVDAEQVS